MGAVKKADIPEIAAFMPAFWEFIKAVWIPENSNEYWEDVHSKANDLYKKYPNRFAKCMIRAFSDYLDEECQRRLEGDRNVQKGESHTAKLKGDGQENRDPKSSPGRGTGTRRRSCR